MIFSAQLVERPNIVPVNWMPAVSSNFFKVREEPPSKVPTSTKYTGLFLNWLEMPLILFVMFVMIYDKIAGWEMTKKYQG